MVDLYRENILDHYKNPRNFGKMKDPDVIGRDVIISCGDKIEMQVKFSTLNLQSSIIKDIKFYGYGCAISMAVASMLTEKVKGKSIESVKSLQVKDIVDMLGVRLTPIRLKCAILPLQVLDKALALAKNRKDKV